MTITSKCLTHGLYLFFFGSISLNCSLRCIITTHCLDVIVNGYKIVNFSILDGDIPRSVSCGVCVSWLIRFAGASSYVTGFSTCSGLLTQKLLEQGY